MRGAVPCLSKDLTTHAVPNFIKAFKMGRRTAPKARGAEGAERVMSELTETLCADSDYGRGREARQGLQPGDERNSLRRAAAGVGAEAHDL